MRNTHPSKAAPSGTEAFTQTTNLENFGSSFMFHVARVFNPCHDKI